MHISPPTKNITFLPVLALGPARHNVVGRRPITCIYLLVLRSFLLLPLPAKYIRKYFTIIQSTWPTSQSVIWVMVNGYTSTATPTPVFSKPVLRVLQTRNSEGVGWGASDATFKRGFSLFLLIYFRTWTPCLRRHIKITL